MLSHRSFFFFARRFSTLSPSYPPIHNQQEGMTALLRAMKSYDNHARYAPSASPFADHAERTVRDALLHYLAESSHGPVRLPARMEEVLRRADEAAARLREERRVLGGTTSLQRPAAAVSLSDVAAEIGVDPNVLASYRRASKMADAAFVDGAVSVEGGVEVYDPALAGVIRGVGTKLRPRGDVEGGPAGTGIATAAGEEGADDALSTTAAVPDPASAGSDGADPDAGPPFGWLDDLDDWDADALNPDRTVTSLRDALPDTDVRNNPLPAAALEADSYVLGLLLDGCLDGTEAEVIRLRFGLERSRHGGRGWTAAEIAGATGMGTDEVRDVAARALGKLREAAREMADDEYLVEVSL